MVLLIPESLGPNNLPKPKLKKEITYVPEKDNYNSHQDCKPDATLGDGSWINCEENPPCYAIKEIPSKGTGVVATRRIFPGEIILVEEPLLVVSEEMFDDPNTARTADYLDKQILKLGSEKLSQFLSLTDCRGDDEGYLGTFYTNCMNYDGAAALFPLMARVNHSCVANSEFVTRADQGHQRLVANYVIEKGEEITINYMPMNEEGSDTWLRRSQYLMKWYTFRCTCPVCTLQEDERAENDRRREEIQEMLAPGLTNLDLGDISLLISMMTEIQAKLTFILDLQEQLFRKTRGVLDRHWAAVKGLDLASQVYGCDSDLARTWRDRASQDPLTQASCVFAWS